jgi:hypothetical protein
MRQEMAEWIYQQLTEERANHGGEFILVTSDGQEGTMIAVEAGEILMASTVHYLAGELSQDAIKALIMRTLSDAAAKEEQ